MYKVSIYLFFLLCAFNQSYAFSDVDSSICHDNLEFISDEKIHSSAQITLVKPLDKNLGLFRINNQSDVDLYIMMAGKQDGYYRYSIEILGYLYIDLEKQEKGWFQINYIEEQYEAPSPLDYEPFDYDETITISPKESIEFITFLWPEAWGVKFLWPEAWGGAPIKKDKATVRLYMELWDKERHYNFIISEPYCL